MQPPTTRVAAHRLLQATGELGARTLGVLELLHTAGYRLSRYIEVLAMHASVCRILLLHASSFLFAPNPHAFPA
jgi:hypothetical protein